jgi:hypothetical protein
VIVMAMRSCIAGRTTRLRTPVPSCGFLGGRRCLQDRLRSGRLRGLVAVEPAAFVVFDLLARNGKDLRDRPYGKRRRKLEELLGASRLPDGLVLTPATTDPTVARGWMLAHRHGSGGHVSPSGSTSCCRALILQTIISFIVPTGDAGGLSSS